MTLPGTREKTHHAITPADGTEAHYRNWGSDTKPAMF
jgi:hypothetical protein